MNEIDTVGVRVIVLLAEISEREEVTLPLGIFEDEASSDKVFELDNKGTALTVAVVLLIAVTDALIDAVFERKGVGLLEGIGETEGVFVSEGENTGKQSKYGWEPIFWANNSPALKTNEIPFVLLLIDPPSTFTVILESSKVYTNPPAPAPPCIVVPLVSPPFAKTFIFKVGSIDCEYNNTVPPEPPICE